MNTMNLKAQYKRIFEGKARSNDQKLLKEATAADAMSIATQFADAVKKKYKNYLYDVKMFKTSGDYMVQAYVDIKSFNGVRDKYWANKFTKDYGGNIPGLTVNFSIVPVPAGTDVSDRPGKTVLKEDYSTMRLKSNIDTKWSDKQAMIDDMSQWLEGVYASGGEDTYDDIMEALQYLIDNFEPSGI